MIDGKPSQFQESVENVNQLRSQLDPNGNFGKVRAHSPDFMRAALSESWLVVEVCCAMNTVMRLAVKTVAVHSRTLAPEAGGHGPT